MDGLIERSSSQAKELDASNNNGVERLKSPKPPLLPKPQIIKLDSKNHKVVKISPSKTSVDDIREHEITLRNNVNKSKALISENSPEKEKQAPGISPKPQLPPKSEAISCLKSNLHLNSPNVLPKPDVILKKSVSVDSTPSRPPRSPQKNIKKDGGDDFTIQKGLLTSAALPNNVILARQKSASLCRNEDLNWALKDIVDDPRQLSEFCKEVEKCSRHSHILKAVNHSPVPPTRWKKKLQDDLDLVTNSSSEVSEESVDEIQSSFRRKGSLSAEESSYMNGYESKDSNDQKSISKLDSDILKPNIEVPKSFLYRYGTICAQTKEPKKCDETIKETNVNVQSFLHKNKDQGSSKSKSSPSPRNSAELDSAKIVKDSCHDNSSKNSPISNDVSKKPEGLSRTESSSSDVTSFSKRFPWFGSFGKGSKKVSAKKDRCFSQFYSSSTDVDTQSILRERKRTKSLPDIKQPRVVSDPNLKGIEVPGILRNSSEYPHSDSDDDKDSLNQIEFSSEKDSKTLAYLKAKELMTSEEVFIDVLKLLNVDFRNYVQQRNFEGKNSYIPSSEINKILNHLSQLQTLNEDILEDLRKRIMNWENNPKIADVIVKKGAFLKMYTTYIQNFESQTNYLDECMVKYPKFGKIVKEFEALDRCKKLTLKHYMLKPVQRIPQYRLLLNDYLKHLDESSADYEDTLSALKIVCEVVDHANRNVTHGDKEGRLMHFQSLLSDYELIKPGRELIKDGSLEKICRKTVRDRYFILLNDVLLHTTYSKLNLKIHQELPLSGMKICYNDGQKYPFSFTVHSITKSFILCAKNEGECKDWVETLQKTIEGHIKRQKTFLNVKIEENTSFKLGKEAPVWVQDGKVTMCQICTAEFTALFRRHHCRGCGKVVCRNCGSNQAPLQYRNFKPDRVCDQCFETLLKDYEESEESICEILKGTLNLNDDSVQNEYLSLKTKFIRNTSSYNWKKQKYIPPRLKEVSANDSESVISGWLYRKSRKSWKLFWYVLKDHVLYVYKASEDVLALDTIPVLGYEVARANEEEIKFSRTCTRRFVHIHSREHHQWWNKTKVMNYEDVDKSLVFSLVHSRQEPITFRAESQDSAERWFEALTSATNLDYLAI